MCLDENLLKEIPAETVTHKDNGAVGPPGLRAFLYQLRFQAGYVHWPIFEVLKELRIVDRKDPAGWKFSDQSMG